jgi:hypothetical protein
MSSLRVVLPCRPRHRREVIDRREPCAGSSCCAPQSRSPSRASGALDRHSPRPCGRGRREVTSTPPWPSPSARPSTDLQPPGWKRRWDPLLGRLARASRRRAVALGSGRRGLTRSHGRRGCELGKRALPEPISNLVRQLQVQGRTHAAACACGTGSRALRSHADQLTYLCRTPYGVRAARDGVRAWEPGGAGMAVCPLSSMIWGVLPPVSSGAPDR